MCRKHYNYDCSCAYLYVCICQVVSDWQTAGIGSVNTLGLSAWKQKCADSHFFHMLTDMQPISEPLMFATDVEWIAFAPGVCIYVSNVCDQSNSIRHNSNSILWRGLLWTLMPSAVRISHMQIFCSSRLSSGQKKGRKKKEEEIIERNRERDGHTCAWSSQPLNFLVQYNQFCSDISSLARWGS